MQYGDAPRAAVSASGVNARGSGAAEADNTLLSLENALLNASETLAAVASIAVDFTYDSQETLFSRVCVRTTLCLA